MIDTLRFTHALLRALWHGAREAYYRLALRTVGHSHPDSLHITHELLRSQRVVNEFLRRTA